MYGQRHGQRPTRTPTVPGLVRRGVRALSLIAVILSMCACSAERDTVLADAADTTTPADASSGDADGQQAADVVWQGHTAIVPLAAVTTDADGLSPAFVLPVAVGATSAVFAVQTEPGVQLAVAQWSGPGGAGLVLPSWLAGPEAPWLCLSGCVVRIAAEPGALAVPWRPDVVADGRPHRLQVMAFAWQDGQISPRSVALEARWILQDKPADFAGAVDLTIVLTGALGWNAAVAPQVERLQTALAFVRDRLAQANIRVATVQYVDVPAANLLLEQTTADLELAGLWQLGGSLPLAIPVFLVEQIYRTTPQGPQPIAGLSGGIPGLPLHVGGPRGGVALSLALQPGAQDRLGPVMAHEISHFLGLFHTSEPASPGQARLHDDLTDTAQDDPANLMYWSPSQESTALSPQQARILRSSPWVRPE
jgi:hypothetical protein